MYVMDAIIKSKRAAAAKGQCQNQYLFPITMGPGVKINPSKVLD